MADAPRLAVCIMGPTASGKSGLAMALAECTGAEIISVDSAQVYRGMDIGTAKPTQAERARVPHHLIDVADPGEQYSAGRFRQQALAAMRDIDERGRLPVLVGGTLLYFRALLQGLSQLPGRDEALRAKLEAQAAIVGWPALHQQLAEHDPVSAGRIQSRDAQRIQRALEVLMLTGQPLSRLQADVAPQAPTGWRFMRVGLVPGDRQGLAERISARFSQMMEQGLLEEVQALFGRGDLGPHTPALRAVGYRQLWRHLAGEVTLERACEQAIVATRQLAKRQLTWLRSQDLEIRLDPLVADALPPVLAGIETARAAR